MPIEAQPFATTTEARAGALNSRSMRVGVGWWICVVAASFLALNSLNAYALDRRFFRERYDSLRVLREIVVEVQEARSIGPAAARVVTRIEAALHPEGDARLHVARATVG